MIEAAHRAAPQPLGLRVGESVEIRGLDEILSTLDAAGALDGLPFMPEMRTHCGTTARVHRRIEKIWDMSGGAGLKRLRDTVVLVGLRCDGSAHGGCQAGCFLLWKEAWLRRPGAPAAALVDPAPSAIDLDALTSRGNGSELRYVCQATELPRASGPLSRVDPRHFIREWLVGNARPWDVIRVLALKAFNWFQGLRGGVGYPQLIPRALKGTPSEPLGLEPGELVRVKGKHEIEATLDAHFKTRGLYFDLDMLRYCGGRYRVLRRIDHLIEERTGRMSHLREPCVTLEGVVATGEYHDLRAQQEFILWRETWLRRAEPS